MIPRIRHLLFDNLLLKLASLVIAVLMWYGVAREPVAEISLQVPVEFSQPPKDLDYTSNVIPQVQLRLRGPARMLRDLPQEDVRVAIDLSGAVPGGHTYDLTPAQVQVPHGVEVMEITPPRLHLVFDKHEVRQVAVKPRIIGILPPGYGVESVTAAPAMVTIAGPARYVNAVEDVPTDTVDITGVAGQSSFEATPYLTDPLVHLDFSGPVQVVVTTHKITSKAGVH